MPSKRSSKNSRSSTPDGLHQIVKEALELGKLLGVAVIDKEELIIEGLRKLFRKEVTSRGETNHSEFPSNY